MKRLKANRLKANRKILKLLSAAVEQHPKLRFYQILRGLGITLRDETKPRGSLCTLTSSLKSQHTLERMIRTFREN